MLISKPLKKCKKFTRKLYAETSNNTYSWNRVNSVFSSLFVNNFGITFCNVFNRSKFGKISACLDTLILDLGLELLKLDTPKKVKKQDCRFFPTWSKLSFLNLSSKRWSYHVSKMLSYKTVQRYKILFKIVYCVLYKLIHIRPPLVRVRAGD